MTTWIVGRNRHTREWAEGGTSADYPIEHWEVYVVDADDRDAARKAAQAKRRSVRQVVAYLKKRRAAESNDKGETT